MRKILILSLLIISLFVAFVVPASAAVIDPSSYGDYRVDGDKIIYYLNNQFDLFSWRRLHNGSLGDVGSGAHFSYNTQMRYVDNDEIFLYPFGYSNGKSNFIDLGAYPLGSQIIFSAQFELSIPNSTQDYSTQLFVYWHWYDANGNSLGAFNSFIQPIETGQHLRQYNLSRTFSCTDPNVRYFDLYFRWEFSGVASETDTVSVTVDADTYGLSFGFPVDRLGQLIDQGKLTNQQLDKIDQALQDNGQKLDDVLKEQQSSNDKLDEMVTRPVTPVEPEGSDDVQDFHDKESGLVGDAFDDFQRDDTLGDAIAGLRERATAFLAVSWIFNLLYRDIFFADLLYISLAVGMFAAFLNIIIHSGSSGKEKSPKHRDNNSQKRIGGK